MTSVLLPPKLPGAKVYVDFDFTNLFNDAVRSGVTISGTPTITIVAKQGVESPVTLAVDGSGAVDATGLIWSQRFKGGISGVTYLLTCEAVGSNGADDFIQLLLPVVDLYLG